MSRASTTTYYVFDFSLSPKLAQCLNVLLPEIDIEDEEPPFGVDHRIHHFNDEDGLAPDAAPTVWIPLMAARGRIVVTCLKASKRKHVNDVMAANGLRAVHLAESFVHLGIFDQASKLAAWWEKIVKASYRLKGGASSSWDRTARSPTSDSRSAPSAVRP